MPEGTNLNKDSHMTARTHSHPYKNTSELRQTPAYENTFEHRQSHDSKSTFEDN